MKIIKIILVNHRTKRITELIKALNEINKNDKVINDTDLMRRANSTVRKLLTILEAQDFIIR